MEKKQCKWCKEIIDELKLSKCASGEFCSKSCASKYSQSFINYDELKPGNCSACGKEMMIKKNASSKLVKCDNCRKKRVRKTTWKSGKYDIEDILNGKYPKYGSSKLRRRLIKEGYKKHECEICGTIEWNGEPVQLILDHIDGNSMNHLLENLRIVCPNCDAQSQFYCSKNYGNGRTYRLKYYHENKPKI